MSLCLAVFGSGPTNERRDAYYAASTTHECGIDNEGPDLAESDTGVPSRPHFFLGGVERIQICIVVDASEGGVLEGWTGEQREVECCADRGEGESVELLVVLEGTKSCFVGKLRRFVKSAAA